MYFLLSGEGPTDIGTCADGSLACGGTAFLHGPMSAIVDRLVERKHHYSILDFEACGFISEGGLAQRAAELKSVKKSARLPGKKRGKETRYYFNNARVMARIAREREEQRKEPVVAVLFRDSDWTASAGRGLWNEKRESILDGFEEERFERGVPMVPKPKSEAWLLCALRRPRYANCDALEDESGNDRSPNSLKKQLAPHIGERPVRETLVHMVVNGIVDVDRINMPSFREFRQRLEDVIE